MENPTKKGDGENKSNNIEGPRTDENIQRCYRFIAAIMQKDLKASLNAGKTEEEFLEDLIIQGKSKDAKNNAF